MFVFQLIFQYPYVESLRGDQLVQQVHHLIVRLGVKHRALPDVVVRNLKQNF